MKKTVMIALIAGLMVTTSAAQARPHISRSSSSSSHSSTPSFVSSRIMGTSAYNRFKGYEKAHITEIDASTNRPFRLAALALVATHFDAKENRLKGDEELAPILAEGNEAFLEDLAAYIRTEPALTDTSPMPEVYAQLKALPPFEAKLVGEIMTKWAETLDRKERRYALMHIANFLTLLDDDEKDVNASLTIMPDKGDGPLSGKGTYHTMKWPSQCLSKIDNFYDGHAYEDQRPRTLKMSTSYYVEFDAGFWSTGEDRAFCMYR